MSEISWSKEQLDVINSIDSNTLVSASAGSGKTAVMIERLIRIIASGTPINEIIMVTFNNSVAQELRLKVSKALKKKLEVAKDNQEKEYLREQIEMVPMSNISTLHALCATIIRENFEVVGIDPSFGIIDEESQALLFDTSVNEILTKYESEYNKDFEMVYKYLTRYGFKDVIKRLNDFIVAQPNRTEYFEKIKEYSTNNDLNKMPIIDKYYNMLKDELFNWKDGYENYCRIFIENGFRIDKFVEDHAKNAIEVVESLLMCSNFQELVETSQNLKIASVPSLNKVEKENVDFLRIHDEYKAFNARVRVTLKEIQEYSLEPFSYYQERANKTAPYINVICDFVKEVIDCFSEHKLEENKLDFNDLEYYSVQILSKDEIAQEYKEKYKYVCVDEYQDINAVQEFILNKISNGKNLFMVGDSKQSIYGFRLTDTNIFLNKLKAYKNDSKLGKAFYLNANYRSEECILKFVNDIFNEIMTDDFCGVDYKNEAQLVFGQKDYEQLANKPVAIKCCQKLKAKEKENDPDGPYYPENWVYSIEEDDRTYEESEFNPESLYIINKIQELVGKQEICCIEDGKAIKRLVEYKDIAILCAKRSDSNDLIKAFERYSIPADTSSMEMQNTSTEVNLLLEILKTIDNPQQDYALIAAMTSFIGNITMNELVEIREATKDVVEKSIPFNKDGKRRPIYFFEYVYEMSKGDSELAVKVKNFINKLDRYRVIASFSQVSDLIKRIIYDNKYDDIILMKPEGKQRLSRLMSYVNSLKDKYYNNSLAEFIKFADEAPVITQSSSGQGLDENSIIMSTLHKSKGLEYPIVFYMGCCNAFVVGGKQAGANNKILLDKDFGMTMPVLDTENFIIEDNLVYKAMSKYQKLQNLKERMRLLYVGLTRAKNMLFVTGCTSNNPKEILIPNDAKSFMDWIQYALNKNENLRDRYLDDSVVDISSISNNEDLDISFNKPNSKQLKEIEQSIKINYKYEESKTLAVKHTVTSLNKKNYDEIHEMGDLNYKPELVGGPSSAAVGTAMHRALQLIDFDLDTLEDVTKALDKMVEDDKMLASERAIVNDELILKCLQSPIIDLARKSKCHYREKIFIINVEAKHLIDDCKSDDKVMLEGVIDLLIETDEGYVLVDYKHSQKSDSLLRYAYQKQLDLYAYAIESTTDRKVISKNLLVIDDGRVVSLN